MSQRPSSSARGNSHPPSYQPYASSNRPSRPHLPQERTDQTSSTGQPSPTNKRQCLPKGTIHEQPPTMRLNDQLQQLGIDSTAIEWGYEEGSAWQATCSIPRLEIRATSKLHPKKQAAKEEAALLALQVVRRAPYHTPTNEPIGFQAPNFYQG